MSDFLTINDLTLMVRLRDEERTDEQINHTQSVLITNDFFIVTYAKDDKHYVCSYRVTDVEEFWTTLD